MPETEPSKPKNHDGPHVWSAWHPQDRTTHYRQCLRMFCPAVETMEAPRA